MILLYIGMCLFHVVWGCVNALIWGRRGAESFKLDEHWFIVVLEVLFWLLILYVGEFRLPTWDVRVAVISAFAAKSFFKDGAMYYTRNKIDGSYPGGWLAEPSRTSTALLNIPMPVRILLFIASILLLWYAGLH